VANITVTVPDEVYDAARLRAAESRTSVSALVREYLIRVAAQGSTYERLLVEQEALLTRVHERAAGYDAGQRLSREDVHDRDALR
jgi:plasmid stability protein